MYRRREFEHEDDDQQERWLLSYADLMTLLFAFFVVMYATSTINLNKYRDLSKAVVTAFQGNAGNMQALAPNSAPKAVTTVVRPLPLDHVYAQKKARDREKLHAIAQSMANALGPAIEDKTVTVTENNQGIRIQLLSDALFTNNNSQLSTAGNTTLKQLITPFGGQIRPITIEGHTAVAAPMAWQLSAQQAALVAQAWINLGWPAKQVTAVALADTHPIAIGETELAQRLNRRITVVIPVLSPAAQQSHDNSDEITLLPMTAERLLAEQEAAMLKQKLQAEPLPTPAAVGKSQ